MSMRLKQKVQSGAWGTGLLIVWIFLITGQAAAQQETKECELDRITLVAAGGETQGQQTEGNVEERAVPRMQPGRPPMAPFKGATIEGNKLTAAPGYNLDVRQDGVIMMMPVGGGLGATGRCNCSSYNGGSCYAQRDSNKKVSCVPKGGCTSCSIIIDNAAMGGMRAIQ